MALTLKAVRVSTPGFYLVELYCDAQWVADTTLLLPEWGTAMDQKTEPQPSQHHRPETVSTASLQSFEDPPGGLPLDSPDVQVRQRQQQGRPACQPPNTPGRDMPKDS